MIELPGVTEPERVRKLLQGTAELEFYNTFDNTEALPILNRINTVLAAKAKASKDSVKTSTANTSANKPAAKADSTAKGAKSLISKITKNSSKSDTTGLAGKAQALAQNPLFAVLAPMYSQSGPLQGPVIGHAAKKDTAKVNAMLRSPEVKAVIPQNMKFLWSVKSTAEENSDDDNAASTTQEKIFTFAILCSYPTQSTLFQKQIIFYFFLPLTAL